MIDASTINLIPVVLFVMHVVIGTPGWPTSGTPLLRITSAAEKKTREARTSESLMTELKGKPRPSFSAIFLVCKQGPVRNVAVEEI